MLSRFEQFTGFIAALSRDIQRIEREEMEKQGLRGAFAQYLLAMSQHPEGITAAALCDICDKDKAAVSRILSEMDSKGLLLREDSAKSYRAKLFLSPEGKKAATFVKDRAFAAVELAGEGLSMETRKIFYTALEQIAFNLHTLAQEGIPD